MRKENLNSFFKPLGQTLQPIWQFMLPWLMEKAGVRKRRGLAKDFNSYDLIISFVAILLLASPLIGIALLWRENRQLQTRLENLEHFRRTASLAIKNSATPNSLDHSFLKLAKPAEAMVTGNQMTIEGEAQDGQIISLVQGDWVRAVTLPNGGHFTLPPVTIKPGQNEFTVQALGHNGKIIALQRIAIISGRPTVNYLATDLSRGHLERKQVALTFDGGSTDNAAVQILDILKQNQLQVTIFLTGGFIQKFPDITRRIVQEGHEVGNHTWSHPHLTSFASNKHNETLPNVTREFLQDQLIRTARLFEEITGTQMAPFWRAPFGEHNEHIRQWAAELGYRHIGWTRGRSWDESMDTLDWVADTTSRAYHTAEEILAHFMAMADNETHGLNGGIILMHLGSHRQDGDHFYTVLPRLITALREKNYALVKISELLE
ncbi:MAG: polysaccharide deacetylase family protein [candidate division KSB1 bacterium]|nr:polysaccharide deacetylase family protein [candidate division KSB1 bacterium]